MTKTTTTNWEQVNKEGMVLTGFFMGSNEVVRKIINQYDAQTAMLYLIILSHRNGQTGACFPSREVLAKEMNVAVKTISRMLKKLHEGGFLLIDSGKQGCANTYYFPMEQFYNGEGVVASRRKKGNFAKSGTNDTVITEEYIEPVVVDKVGFGSVASDIAHEDIITIEQTENVTESEILTNMAISEEDTIEEEYTIEDTTIPMPVHKVGFGDTSAPITIHEDIEVEDIVIEEISTEVYEQDNSIVIDNQEEEECKAYIYNINELYRQKRGNVVFEMMATDFIDRFREQYGSLAECTDKEALEKLWEKISVIA